MVGIPIITDQEPLQAKYQRPELCQNTIARHSFYEKLDRSQIYKLTTITAPAGYGKSTAVADWVERSNRDNLNVSWLTLEPADNDPIRFWIVFLHAWKRPCRESAKRQKPNWHQEN